MGFFIYLHYYMEQIDRRMFVLRSQLKISYRAQQKAQVGICLLSPQNVLTRPQMKEKQAANSKRRFISYIFHEVRVPLNSAMLAFQNMQTNNAFEHCKEDQAVEIHALEGSMAAMKQVLDDVLDLQRMDSGKFENKPQPFPFHRAVQSMLGSLKVSTAAKNLDLKVEFDERIDDVLSKAEAREEGVWVVGDPLRLRQVLTNFTSNAVKFTPEGQGEITYAIFSAARVTASNMLSISVKTILIGGPRRAPSRRGFIQKGVNNDGNEFDREGDDTTADDSGPNIRRLESSFRDLEDPPFAEQELRLQENSIVIRIEVSDAGPGIRPSDAENLFEPCVF
jgi:signal transduction histidine kinase